MRFQAESRSCSFAVVIDGPPILVQTPYSLFEEALCWQEWHDLLGEMRSMATDLPLFEQDRILRAAERTISFYGKHARADPDGRAQVNQAAALNGQAD